MNNIIINEYAISDVVGQMTLSLTSNPAGNILLSNDIEKSARNCIDVSSKTLELIIEENSIQEIDF